MIEQLLLLFYGVKQKKHNHGFPRENNYLPKGDHGWIRMIEQLLLLFYGVKQKKHNHGFPRENNYLPKGDHGWIRMIEQLSPEGISWFDLPKGDPTIIVLRTIMVRQSIIAILYIFLL
jgi:hypothetical protein